MGGVITKQKIRGLDELRGIAAVMIVIYHIYQSYFRGIPNYNAEGVLVFPETFNPNYNILNELSAGVNLFFVLSGFLIHLLYANKYFDWQASKVFLSKRLFRILPPYYASVAIALAGGLVISYLKIDIWNVLMHVLCIHNFDYGYAFSIQAVYWSIAVEVQFYILYCMYRFIADRYTIEHKLLWFFAFCLTVSVIYKLVLYLSIDNVTISNAGMRWLMLYNTILRFPEWLLGALFFEYLPLIKKIKYKYVWILLLLVFTTVLNHYFVWHVFGSDLVYSIAFSLLIVSLTDLKKDVALFVFLGNISYSLYLNHFLIYSVWDTAWLRLLHLPRVASAERILIMVSGFFVCIAGSYILYRLIEKPAMNLKSVWVDAKSEKKS
ncbi:acyltransferase family protein [Cytophaga hutchinsonii]|uniref:Acyltransferase family protein n=1 Tax=Cytophaga hutchinsonii (strain ATCC 33406 / DSM 1761 / CIP 103989 / NBRC 15051 / NCIMB 9469 / D465) TaxID=269798 RepID=A0A6N4SPF4_CYTH3|nr:acyltransferase [Cytophaga hutchinsonii]ABG58174.1 acyltransferase family protein [Cytophaga hutchinsonii ATCC 33406]SFY02643.1 Peptidoglycan/LPS O-acetylase OafA/YrhL, contains acyltransferase and SGNH-hydrolase domains [Cytophaga hutchinsonii ATCC 33406]